MTSSLVCVELSAPIRPLSPPEVIVSCQFHACCILPSRAETATSLTAHAAVLVRTDDHDLKQILGLLDTMTESLKEISPTPMMPAFISPSKEGDSWKEFVDRIVTEGIRAAQLSKAATPMMATSPQGDFGVPQAAVCSMHNGVVFSCIFNLHAIVELQSAW